MYSRLLNSAPSTGTSINAGTPFIACLVWSLIMPAMASAPPEGISTVVSVRRTWIDGMVTGGGPDRVNVFSLERSETSVITLRLMRPSESTTGVKLRLTPNFLKSMPYWQIEDELPEGAVQV